MYLYLLLFTFTYEVFGLGQEIDGLVIPVAASEINTLSKLIGAPASDLLHAPPQPSNGMPGEIGALLSALLSSSESGDPKIEKKESITRKSINESSPKMDPDPTDGPNSVGMPKKEADSLPVRIRLPPVVGNGAQINPLINAVIKASLENDDKSNHSGVMPDIIKAWNGSVPHDAGQGNTSISAPALEGNGSSLASNPKAKELEIVHVSNASVRLLNNISSSFVQEWFANNSADVTTGPHGKPNEPSPNATTTTTKEPKVFDSNLPNKDTKLQPSKDGLNDSPALFAKLVMPEGETADAVPLLSALLKATVEEQSGVKNAASKGNGTKNGNESKNGNATSEASKGPDDDDAAATTTSSAGSSPGVAPGVGSTNITIEDVITLENGTDSEQGADSFSVPEGPLELTPPGTVWTWVACTRGKGDGSKPEWEWLLDEDGEGVKVNGIWTEFNCSYGKATPFVVEPFVFAEVLTRCRAKGYMIAQPADGVHAYWYPFQIEDKLTEYFHQRTWFTFQFSQRTTLDKC